MIFLQNIKSEFKKIIHMSLDYLLCNIIKSEIDNSLWIDLFLSEKVHAFDISGDFNIGKNDIHSYDLISKHLFPKNVPLNSFLVTQAQLLNRSYIYSLKNAKLLGKYPLIYTDCGHLIKDAVFFSDEHARLREQLLFNKKFSLLRFYKRTKKINIECAVLMFSLWNHFGHWLPEHALKLRKVNLLREEGMTDIKLIVEDDFPSWKMDVIKRLGWNESDLIYWKYNEMEVINLIIPSYPIPSYHDFKWLKESLVPQSFKTKQSKNIYLSRHNYPTRKVSNENELELMLQKYNFETIYPEEISLEEQVKILKSAKIVIAPHGSALTNIIFSDNIKVIELFGTHVPLAFYCLSMVLGFEHHQLYCEDDGSRNSNIYVNTNQLESIIIEII